MNYVYIQELLHACYNNSSCNNNYNVFVYEPSARVVLANRAIFGVVYMYFVVHNLSRDPPLTRPVEGLAS